MCNLGGEAWHCFRKRLRHSIPPPEIHKTGAPLSDSCKMPSARWTSHLQQLMQSAISNAVLRLITAGSDRGA